MLDFISTNVVFSTSKNPILEKYVIAQECPHSCVWQHIQQANLSMKIVHLLI
jgi:hypothetical protein